MSNKQRGLLITFAILLTMLLSACTQSLSSAPTKTAATNPTSAFVSPLATNPNPMEMIEQFAKQTAAVQTSAAGGGAVTTPQAVAPTLVGGAVVVASTSTPGVGVPSTPTNAVGGAPASGGGVNPTPVPSGVRPATYTLQNGEFPYCIARRFNVDPDQLLSLSGITSPDLYYQGQVLKIPQSGAFPGSRSLAAHPANYTVLSSDETFYSIACKFGDVDPAAIASLNGISAAAKLSAGQQIKIP